MISKELLNKNRVLTMSNGRTCDKLVINFKANPASSRDSMIIMGIRDSQVTKDILFIKELHSNDINELVDMIYWNCKEYGIKTVLIDIYGYGRAFYDFFKDNTIKQNINVIFTKGTNVYGISEFLRELHSDIEDGRLRFLQTPESALFSYDYPFLGFSEVMNSHRETTKLINEIDNIYETFRNGTLRLERKNNEIDCIRATCLIQYYGYPLYDKVD